jgi:Cytochrome c554 and c-prime
VNLVRTWLPWLLLLACHRPGALSNTAPRTVTLFMSQNLLGTLAPCGCSANMRGGISRSAKLIRDAPGALYVDVGSALSPTVQVTDDLREQQQAKAESLAQVFKSVGLWARVAGPFDDALGVAFHGSLKLPELDAVHHSAQQQGVALVAAPTLELAQQFAREARTQGAVFVAAVVDEATPQLLGSANGNSSIDVLIPRLELHEANAMVEVTNSKIAHVQSRGRSLLRVDIHLVDSQRIEWLKGKSEQERELALLDERVELLRAQTNAPGTAPELLALKNQKLLEVLARRRSLANTPVAIPGDRNSATFQFVAIEQQLPVDKDIENLQVRLDEKIGALNVAWAQKYGRTCASPSAELQGVVGTATCQGCHPTQVSFWEKTKHAQAYTALTSVKKQFHVDCIGCHVTGWQKPGGVCRIDQTQGREGVGCESCHGFANTHIQAPSRNNITTQITSQTCVGCHDPENSPHFDFETWSRHIVGPGHGAPL